jgi:hypothetical protein
MKKLIFVCLVGATAWYGWTHYKGLLQRQPSHEAVIQNQTSHTLDRIRLKVDGQTLVKETLPAGETARLPFRVNHDSSFELWWGTGPSERSWTGGLVPAGPMAQRHSFTIGEGDEVMYRAEGKQGPG